LLTIGANITLTTFNILHLEDEAILRDYLRELLSILVPEASVQQFSNSNDALEYVSRSNGEVHLFLLDVRVPGRFDGIGLAIRLRQIGCTGTIVFCSAYARPSLPGDLNYTWLGKPFDLADLLKITNSVYGKIINEANGG
jgi:CheY-like chemotaxis protein